MREVRLFTERRRWAKVRRTPQEIAGPFRGVQRHIGSSTTLPPGQASAEELRQYLLHLTDNGVSPTSYNACLPALKFFFQTTLDRPEVVRKLRTLPAPQRLPKVLSRDEVRRLLEATTSLKYKAAFSIAYRASGSAKR